MAGEARALVLAPETPYPLAGGGALRTASLLHHLARTYAVDLIVFRQPGAPDPADALPAGLVNDLTVIDLPLHRSTPAARALRNAARLARRIPPLMDRFSGFAAGIASAIAGRRYQIGVIEHFWCAPYLDQIAPVCDRAILDLHNIESVLHARCAAAETSAAAIAHRVFERVSRELEAIWLPRFSGILTTSEADAARVRLIAPRVCAYVYPNAIPFAPLPAATSEEAIVFSGNMEYHPNRAAIRFFRREVWPLLRERWPALIWRLVGKNADAVRALTAGDPRIEVTGPVDDAIAELARARVAVVPLLAGSGTRLKILEAWAAGVPVVSTPIGAEGLSATDGENILLAERPADFARSVSRLLECNTLRQIIGLAGRSLLEKEFTWERVWPLLPF